MDTTATASIGELLEREFPDGCTGEQAIQFKRRAGHSFGSPQAALREMGSNLAGGAGSGSTRSGVSRKSKIITGNLRKGKFK